MSNTNTLASTKFKNNIRVVSGTYIVMDSDVVLLCDTSSAPVTIELAQIPADFFSTQYKLYVVDNNNNASVNNIIVNAPTGFTINAQPFITYSTNGGSFSISIGSNTNYISSFSSNSPSPTGIQIKTYTELQALSSANQLIQGEFYLLSDFQLKYSVEGATVGTTLSSDEASIAPVTEPLILYATTTSTFSTEAFSTLHQNDIVFYNFNDNTFTVTSGIKDRRGFIIRRIDTVRNIDIAWDWRYQRFTRSVPLLINGSSIASLAWNIATAYPARSVVVSSNLLFISVKAVTGGSAPNSYSDTWLFTGIDVTRYTITEGGWLGGSTSANGGGTTRLISATYAFQGYFYTFSNNNLTGSPSNVSSNASINNIKIEGGTNTVFFGNALLSTTLVSRVNIGTSCVANTIYTPFLENTIGSCFSYNYMVGQQIIPPSFDAMSYLNTFGNDFSGNIISTQCTENNINNSFKNNVIGSGFMFNNISDSFSSNLSISFQLNIVGSRFQNNNIDSFTSNTAMTGITFYDFTGGNLIKGININCTIQKREDGTVKMSYIDNTDTLIISSPLA